MDLFAAPQASYAGVLTSIATVITALTVLLGAVVGGVKVVVPLLRETRNNTKQLQIIHTLVNSTLTAALAAQLDGLMREKLLLGEMMSLGTRDGHPPSDAQKEALTQVQHKIEELASAMHDRSKQTAAADIQIAQEKLRKSE